MLEISRPSNRPNHEGRNEDEVRPQTVEQAIRDAHGILAGAGVRLSPSKVARLARDFIRKAPPLSFATYLTRNTGTSLGSIPYAPGNRHRIMWADPTGDTAVQNVMQQAVGA